MEKQDRKRRIFVIIQIGNREDFISMAFDIVISILILLSIAVTFLQTFDELSSVRPVLSGIETFTIVIFTLEYALRLYTSDLLYPEETKGRALLHFVGSFYGIVDLLTILSFFIPVFFSNGMVVFRLLRVIRIFRLFRINASYDAFNVIWDVLRDKWDQILSSVVLILILMFVSSLCMYSLEHDAQPEVFANGFSGLWWSMSTLLTVGYGDIYPITVGGRIMAIVFAFLGVGLVAIPTGIISAGFVEYYSRRKKGEYSQRNDDFVMFDVKEEDPLVGKQLGDVHFASGIFVAALMRGEDLYTPYESLQIASGDSLLLATTSNRDVGADIYEIALMEHHDWIQKAIKDLDISRRSYIIMVRRGDMTLQPSANLVLEEGDVVVLLHKE